MSSSGLSWLRQLPVFEAPQGSGSKDTIRNKATHELPHATPTRVEIQATPSPDQLARRYSPQPYVKERQDSPTRHDLTNEGDSNGSAAKPPKTKLKSRLQKNTARPRLRRSYGIHNKDSPSKNNAEAARQTIYQRESQYRADHDRNDTAEVESEDMYDSGPSTHGEREQDAKDDDYRPPPHKRQKKILPSESPLLKQPSRNGVARMAAALGKDKSNH